ncbi:transposase [Gluconacetobacter sp. 1c LMG 22058]|uniref:Transposase n=1 Tax=Gluconacetobacter dulcium TaxID=2729096 RepID=A0A7W4PJJ5_9PROT|nr:transposase [Gluconacetobacter dulcium]MBB2198639.1 transposase [Gluconacetobacter dulcium]
MDMRQLVGRNFARLRRERGLTQQQVEERSGFSQQYLSDLERGMRNPSIISLYEIAKALDASPLDLLQGAPAPRSRRVPAAPGTPEPQQPQQPVEVETPINRGSIGIDDPADAPPDRLFVLDDAQWERMRSRLERWKPSATTGRKGENCRLFVEAVLWIVRTGRPWRALPATFGNWNSIYRRYQDWAKTGTFAVMLDDIAGDDDAPVEMQDDMIVWKKTTPAAPTARPIPGRLRA